MSDTEYRIGGKGKDRRSDPRKTTGSAIAIEVQDLPAEKAEKRQEGDKSNRVKKKLTYEKMRQTPRKRTPEEMRASILADGFSNGVIEDGSRGGLRINSAIRLMLEKEIGIFFKVPGKNQGITLICQVKWLKDEGMYHRAGLRIIETTDNQSFLAFVDGLPPLEAVNN